MICKATKDAAGSARLCCTIFGALLVVLISCCTAAVAGDKTKDSSFRGKASWYGTELKGHRTASGKAFDHNSMVAAHRTLPFGTKVLVKCLKTGASCVVEVADRGPHVGGRVIDVSRAAAQKLRLISRGVGPVECRVIDAKTAAALMKDDSKAETSRVSKNINVIKEKPTAIAEKPVALSEKPAMTEKPAVVTEKQVVVPEMPPADSDTYSAGNE